MQHRRWRQEIRRVQSHTQPCGKETGLSKSRCASDQNYQSANKGICLFEVHGFSFEKSWLWMRLRKRNGTCIDIFLEHLQPSNRL